MTTQVKKQVSIFPDCPRSKKIVDKDGNMNDEWYRFFDQLSLALQTNLTPEGFVMPQQSAANILLLTATQSIANILYDSTNDEFKGNIAGTWKTFTLT
jgi:hypothetical protein